MFEKIALKAIIGATGVTFIVLCGYLVYMMVGDMKQEKRMNKIMDDLEASHQLRRNIIEQMIKERCQECGER